MPKVTRFVSSLSGTEVNEAEAYRVRINGGGKYFEADLTTEEGKQAIADLKAEEKAVRGRKAAAAK